MYKLTPSDYFQVAALHKKMLKNSGFLSDCTISFISHFYKTIQQYDSSLILIDKSINSNIVSGFAFLSLDNNNYFRKFLYKNIFLIVINPFNFVSFIKATAKKYFQKKIPTHDVELVHIAVDSNYQGKGVAKKLINGLENILIGKNIKEYYLQVFEDNLAAKNLYLNIDFKIIHTFMYGRRNKLLMKKNLIYNHNRTLRVP